jgi:hypothetical protein
MRKTEIMRIAKYSASITYVIPIRKLVLNYAGSLLSDNFPIQNGLK